MRRSAYALLLAASCALSGCGVGVSAHPLPAATALREAKAHLDGTSGLHMVIDSQNVPDSAEALVSADGMLSRAPAFSGAVTANLPHFGRGTVKVVAINGILYADVFGWMRIDPATYGIPDPAQLLDPHTGVSALLVRTHGVTVGHAERGGPRNDQIITTYTGTLDGTDVARLLPGAVGTFSAAYTIDGSGVLQGAVLKGEFDPPAVSTYVITLDQYGATPQISAPS